MDNLFATIWLILQASFSAAPETTPPVNPDTSNTVVVASELSCALEHKGDNFVAVVEADASYAIQYELKLKSTGSNVMRFTRRDEFEVAPGSTRKDLSANVRVNGQKVTGDLILRTADHADVHCTTR